MEKKSLNDKRITRKGFKDEIGGRKSIK